MTTNRILSTHGNVIAADFRPRAVLTVTLGCKTEILYEDAHVMLTRTTVLMDGRATDPVHLAGDKATGRIVQL